MEVVLLTDIEKKRGFEPIVLKITFENEKEIKQFKEMVRHCDTVPEAIISYGSKIDSDFVENFMSKIYNTVDGIY
jgi:hypothetical protein